MVIQQINYLTDSLIFNSRKDIIKTMNITTATSGPAETTTETTREPLKEPKPKRTAFSPNDEQGT
jgi:hypothetical protein